MDWRSDARRTSSIVQPSVVFPKQLPMGVGVVASIADAAVPFRGITTGLAGPQGQAVGQKEEV